MKRRVLTALVLALLLTGGLLSGCSEDNPVAPGATRFATPDALVDGLKAYYSGMDYAGYVGILESDFRFILQNQDLNECDLITNYLDRIQEQAVTNRMFNGAGGLTCDGYAMPPIEGITVNLFLRSTEWTLVTDPESHFVGSSRAQHNFQIVFNHATAFQSRIEGLVQVHARDIDPGPEADWKLTGLEHVSPVKASEDRTWGVMRLYYRGDS